MRGKRKDEFEPDYEVPPGVTLHEVMESLQMSQKELAQRTGLTEQTLTRIFKGDQPISYETANRLELVTGDRCTGANVEQSRSAIPGAVGQAGRAAKVGDRQSLAEDDPGQRID
ncbi:MAG: helix-turn-helix transcriptional regulator [Desulfobulbus sp.]|nr:helix-turn-helix transcriptional regulator [Desulfobulbus sp.]